MNFLEKRISINKAISILAKNGIHVNEQETAIILDFLYLMAKYYNIYPGSPDAESLKRNRTLKKG